MKKENKIDSLTSNKIVIVELLWAVTVVYHHCSASSFLLNVQKDNMFFTVLENILDSFLAMDSFFLVSGFLFYYNVSKENVRYKVKKRLYSLGIPFIIWNMLCFLVISYYRHGGIDYFLSFFIKSQFDGPLWYAEILILYLIMIPVLLKLFCYRKATIICILCANLVRSFFWIRGDIYITIRQFFIYLPAYITGAYFGFSHFDEVIAEKWDSKRIKVAFFCTIVLYIILTTICKVYGFGKYFNLYSFLSYELQLFFGIGMWSLWSKKYFVKPPKSWQRKGFFVYASQWIVIYFLTIMISKLFAGEKEIGSLQALMFRIIMTCIVFITTITMGEIIERFAPKVYKILIGGR